MFSYLFPGVITFGGDEVFKEIIIFVLPLLIANDSLSLSIKELKENFLSLFILVIVNILLSIGLGVLFIKYVYDINGIGTYDIILLLSIVMATDPVGVSSIFNNFKVPHKLKVNIEGESLFNDPIALIIFTTMLGIIGGTITGVTDISLNFFKIIFISLLVGLVFGYIGLLLLKKTNDLEVELVIFLAVAYCSYLISEHFHDSGILAIITSLVLTNHIVGSRMKGEVYTSQERHKSIGDFFKLGGIFANAILFTAMASVIDFSLIYKYIWEIIFMFVLTTLIRAIVLIKYAWISNKTDKIVNINFRWRRVMVNAGMKGGLSILMVLLIPVNYPYREIFMAIVFGIVFLSIFVYSFFLILEFMINGKKFENE